MTEQFSREDEERLRRALRAEAAQMFPSADGLERIRERTARVPLWRRPVVLGLVAAAATAVVVIGGAFALLRGPGDGTTLDPAGPGATVTGPSPTDSPAGTPEASPDEPGAPPPEEGEPASPPPEGDPATTVTVPVYHLADTPQGPRLAREWRAVPARGTPAETAIATMLGEPADPDYRSPWDRSVQVRSVEIRDGAINVDLGIPAGAAPVPPAEAELAVQQLVYTATAAVSHAGGDGSLPVRVLVDGAEIGELFGQVDVSDVLRRADPLSVRQRVQINDPTEGATTGSPLRVTGEAAVFEAHLDWQVLDHAGSVVAQDFVTADACCTFSPFEFEVELEPGSYVLVVSESDASGGEGPGPTSDTRSFVVE